MKKLTIFCLISILLGASPALAEKPEVLLGMATDFNSGTITIDVVSSGCTDKSSFRTDVKDKTLTVYRTRRDACKAMPRKLSISYTLKEVGIDPHHPFKIGNLFIVNENLSGL